MRQTFASHCFHSTVFAETCESVEDMKLMARFIAQSDFRTLIAFKALGTETKEESEGN